MRIGLVLLLVLAPSARSAGQDPGPIHDHEAFCGTDLRSVDAWDNLARYAAAKASGELDARRSARKAVEVIDLGDRRSFNVLEDNWAPREFELRDENTAYRLWVATSDLGAVTEDEIAGLRRAMVETTPGRSIDPSRGILENNRLVFGEMPNFDGDGILDILMYDMKAGDGTGTVILGYVSSSDLLMQPPQGVGNQRDALYLDAVEGSNSLTTLASVASHELTHLIHYNYLGGRFEDTFVMEGLAEYSMVVNGYDFRGASYLADPLELSVPLFNWRDGGGPSARDYQRASLFFSYLGQRIGPERTGSILRGPASGSFQGSQGLNALLTESGLSLASVVADFHTANRFNDRSLNPAFGYEAPHRASVAAQPTRTFGPQGQTSGSVSLFGGAVEYYSFTGLGFLDFKFDTPSSVPAAQAILRKRVRGRVVFETYEGVRSWEDLAPMDEPYQFRGLFRSVQLVLANVTGTVDTPSAFAFEILWSAVPLGTSAESTGPTGGFALGANYPNPFARETTVPFELADPGSVRLSVYDLLGRLVATPLDRWMPAGSHQERLSLASLTPGAYLIVLESGSARSSRTVTVIR